MSEWTVFLSRRSNKLQVTLHLADFILCGYSSLKKSVYVTKVSDCFYLAADGSQIYTQLVELRHYQREADFKILLHILHSAMTNDVICVDSEDSDVYILYLFAVYKICNTMKVYIKQGKASSKEGVTYHDVSSLASNLVENVCRLLPALHALGGGDYNQPIYGRSKMTIFKSMMKKPQSMQLLRRQYSTDCVVDDVIDFVLHVMYNSSKEREDYG